MITTVELRERMVELNIRLTFALATQAKATEARVRDEMEIIELALVGIKKSEFNDN